MTQPTSFQSHIQTAAGQTVHSMSNLPVPQGLSSVGSSIASHAKPVAVVVGVGAALVGLAYFVRRQELVGKTVALFQGLDVKGWFKSKAASEELTTFEQNLDASNLKDKFDKLSPETQHRLEGELTKGSSPSYAGVFMITQYTLDQVKQAVVALKQSSNASNEKGEAKPQTISLAQLIELASKGGKPEELFPQLSADDQDAIIQASDFISLDPDKTESKKVFIKTYAANIATYAQQVITQRAEKAV